MIFIDARDFEIFFNKIIILIKKQDCKKITTFKI